jgi:ubiquinone/menaquinone biosynthesis C-methylase UbiE
MCRDAAVRSVAAMTAITSELKLRHKAMWASGDYPGMVEMWLTPLGPRLVEALGIEPGMYVLDVASGTGNAAIPATHKLAHVTASDLTLELLEAGRRRADQAGVALEWIEADAEALPFADASFDAVVSTFGVMFTANQDKAAAELLRVCRPGGKIGLANWTPNGFIGQLFKTLGKHMPPPAGVKSPALWGTRERIDEMFGPSASSIETLRRDFMFRYRSPQHWMDVFKTYYGPLLKTFAALQPPAQQALNDDIMALIDRMNISGDDTMVVPAEYVEVVITKR